MTEEDPGEALFPAEDARPSRPGLVLQTFLETVRQARLEGRLSDPDDALVEGTAVMAETLDTARRVGGMKGGYLATQAFPAYLKGLHALRLPVELSAVAQGTPEPDSRTSTEDWFRDTFGTAE